MKIKTKRNEILNPLLVAQYFISPTSTLPLLSNILFDVKEDGIYISATDMDMSVCIKSNVDKIEETGKTTIPKKIISLLKEAPDSEIKIESDKNDSIKIQWKGGYCKIPGLPAEDFPLLKIENNKLSKVKLPQKILKEIIKYTSFAALKDSTKRNLNGVFIKFEGDKIEAVSTDAHRLSYYKITTKIDIKTPYEYIIPLKTINEIAKIIEDKEGKDIEINLYEKLVEFKMDNINIITRVIDENFPNYDQVIPKDFNTKGVVKKADFESALKRTSMILSDRTRIITLKFDKDKMFVTASAQDEGEAYEEIDIKYDATPIDITFNSNYLLDVLKSIETDEIEIKLNSSTDPGVISFVGNNDFVYVVMPIRK
ncbi:MAG: DNA polymerase III subunit beta [Candidatus Goldbacteria bacterium]|nr:DNA polymerase III subunit beta [Candidatus Goldiibacteriota bacterium]